MPAIPGKPEIWPQTQAVIASRTERRYLPPHFPGAPDPTTLMMASPTGSGSVSASPRFRVPALARFCLLLALLGTVSTLAADPWVAPPPLVRNQYLRISDSAEISADLALLASASALARVEDLGRSAQGRPLEALLLADPDPATEPLRVLMIGSQHGASEPASAEAMLELARELLWGGSRQLLETLQVVLIPNANPDGRDLGRRSNARGININTDFVRAREAETRALLRALARYEPQVVLDSHESAVLKRKSLGREGWLTDFEIQYEIANHPGVPAPVRTLSADTLLPALLQAAIAGGHDANRYIGEITSTGQPITNGGLSLRNLRNTAGVQNRISLLLETRLDSGERTYPTRGNIAGRVARQRHALENFLAVVHRWRTQIAAVTALPVAGPFPLAADYGLDRDHPWVDIGLRRRDSGDLVVHRFPDHRRVVARDLIEPPPGYLIVAGQRLLRPLLDAQAIAYTRLDEARMLWALTAAAHPRAEAVRAPPGSLLIDLDQRRGRQVALLLEPRSPSSLFHNPEFAALVEGAATPPVYPLAYPLADPDQTAVRSIH
jgi:hypothetical protein